MGQDNTAGIILMVIYAVLIFVSIGAFIWSIIWAYNDAEQRGKSGCLVALLVAFLSWPLGLVIWLIFRPSNNNFRY